MLHIEPHFVIRFFVVAVPFVFILMPVVWHGRKLAMLGSFSAPNRLQRFDCGDCERNPQCGLPPRDDCEFKIMQLARSRDGPRRPDYLYPAVWPR